MNVDVDGGDTDVQVAVVVDVRQNFHLDPHDFGFIDVNNDGCLDLFMGLCTGWAVFVQTNCPPPPCPEDVNSDGAVNVLDLIELLLAFGTACP